MLPILPILILLLLGPVKAERLAVEGRLPAPLLAAHRAMAPVRAIVAAPVEEEAPRIAARPRGRRPAAPTVTFELPLFAWEIAAPGWPTRAGP